MLTFKGHYVCYVVKSSFWYKVNDYRSDTVRLNDVLMECKRDGYVYLYERCT